MPTREFYWNIAFWGLMYLFALVMLVIAVRGTLLRYRLWRLGRPENRVDRVWDRILSVLTFGFGHKRILREAYPGIMHFAMFWGFAVLFVGTLLVMLQTDFHVPLLYGTFYLWFSLVLDLVGLAAIAGALLAVWRRYALRPKRLDNTADDAITLALILTVLLTGFFIEGFRIAATGDPWAAWSPVGLLFARLFQGLDGNPFKEATHRVLWWFHLVAAFGFMAYFPYSKMFHVLTSPLNQFFRSFRPKGALTFVDLEDESVESYGVAQLGEFTWKQLFDTDACTRCGRCQDNCPAHLTDKPLSPKQAIQDLKAHLRQAGPALLKQKGTPPGKAPALTAAESVALEVRLIGDVFSEDAIWSCTTCRACEEACPVFVEHINRTVDLRRNLVLVESRFPSEVQPVFRNMEVNGNPWGVGWAARADWAAEAEVPTIEDNPGAEILYWVGCAGSFDDRNKKVALSLVKVLRAAGVNFAILGTEEKCCGDSARRAGNEYLFQSLAQENIEVLKGHNVKKIVTHCPHCFNSLKNEYPQLGGEFEVIHHSQYLTGLLAAGRLKPAGRLEGTVAYHDSCYLGRYNEVYAEPRRILSSIPGLRLVEMGRHHDRSFCCGAGGARMWMEEKLGKRINETRTDEAIAAGATIVGTACPFCLTMLEDGIKARDRVESMAALDLAEILARAI